MHPAAGISLIIAVSGLAGWGAGYGLRTAKGKTAEARKAAEFRQQTVKLVESRKAVASTPAGGWMERVRKAAPGELAALWEETETLFADSWNEKQAARSWLLTRWAALDWDGAVNFIQEKGGETEPALLGEALALTDPRRAVEMMNARDAKEMHAKESFRKAVAEELAQKHPALFFQIGSVREADENTDPRRRKIALENLAAADPAAAREVLKDCLTHAGNLKKEWLSAFLTGLSARDGAEAARWVEEQADEELRKTGRQALLALQAERDPLAAAEEVGDGAEAGPEARVKLAVGLARLNTPEALQKLEQLKPSLIAAPKEETWKIMTAFSRAVLETWPAEPQAFLTELKKLPPWLAEIGAKEEPEVPPASGSLNNLQAYLLRQKGATWNNQQMAEAVSVLITEDGGMLTEQRSAQLKHWLAEEFTAARDAAELARLLPEPARGLAWESPALWGAAGLNTEKVQALAEVLPPDQWPVKAGEVLAALGENGVPWIERLPETPQSAEVRAEFAGKWAMKDPDAAGAWVRELPEGKSAEAAAGLVRAWSGFDEMSASLWIATLPPGAARDGAASALVKSIAAGDPEAARVWAESIHDPERRQEAQKTIERAGAAPAPSTQN